MIINELSCTLKFSISVSHASHILYAVFWSVFESGFMFPEHLLHTLLPHLRQWCLLMVMLKVCSHISQAFNSWKVMSSGLKRSGRPSKSSISSKKVELNVSHMEGCWIWRIHLWTWRESWSSHSSFEIPPLKVSWPWPVGYSISERPRFDLYQDYYWASTCIKEAGVIWHLLVVEVLEKACVAKVRGLHSSH